MSPGTPQLSSHLESFMWPSKEALIHQLVAIWVAAASTTALQAAATAAAVGAAAGAMMLRTAAAASAGTVGG